MTEEIRDRRTLWFGVLPVVAWLVLVLPVVCSGLIGTASAWDQEYFHRPVIHILSAGLPAPSFFDYGSATTPGYHLVLAVLDRFGADDLALRIVSSLFALAASVVLARVVARLSTPAFGALSGLLFLLNPYILGSAMHLSTDAFAFLFLILAIAAGIDIARDGVSMRVAVRGMVWSCAAAMVRQVLLWCAGIPFLAVLLRIGAGLESRKLRALAVTSVMNLPGVLLVGAFVVLWEGLIPPGFRIIHGSGVNSTTPIYVLALVGCWGALIAAVHPSFFVAVRSKQAILCGIGAGCLALLVKSSYDGPHDGIRWGGTLWTVARYTPVIMERSIVIVALAVCGGAVIGAILRLAQGHPRRVECWTALLALALGSLAQTLNTKCFERYALPVVLIVIPIAVGVLLPAVGAEKVPSARARLRFPLAALCLLFIVATADIYLRLGRENPPPPLPHEFRPIAPAR